MKFDFDKKVDRYNTHSLKWDLYGEEYHVHIPNKNWIRLVPGIVPALAVASHIGGGRSMTTTPNYCNLLRAPIRAGNELIRVPLKNEEEYYTIDFDALEAAIKEDTKVFYLCNPHNPAGRVYTMDELKQVSAFAEKHQLLVVSDEAHCEVVFEGKPRLPGKRIKNTISESKICPCGRYLSFVGRFSRVWRSYRCRIFQKESKSFLTDGRDFGGEGYVRINFATRREIITQALDRMEKALEGEQ